AAVVDAARIERGALQAPPITPLAEGVERPASFAQQRWWFQERISPGNPAHIVSSTYWLEGPVQDDALRRALPGIVQRHEGVRAPLTEGDGTLLQLPGDADDALLSVDDVTGAPDPHRVGVARLAEETRRPFDVEHGPLLRARLVHISAVEHGLVVAMHHA